MAVKKMNTKITLPSGVDQKLLVEKNLHLWADYRLVGKIEDELRNIFICEELVNGGLNILGYKTDNSAPLTDKEL